MNKLIIFCLFLFISFNVTAQKVQRCGVHNHENNDEAETVVGAAKTQFDPVTIPVVVHVVYNKTVQNITDQQIISQINVLNKDFSAQSIELSAIPSVFAPLVGNTGFQFGLANLDPNGNATNGIVRVQTNKEKFSQVDNSVGDIYYDSTGGSSAWDTKKYLNIWVGNLEGSETGTILLGFATFPTSAGTKTDGIVIHYNRFGNIGIVVKPNDRGRTCTHEIGHYLNLRHIWGDANCGNDLVADTPVQKEGNLDCPTFPKFSCNNEPNGELFMNFMDYTDDACMYMFTKGQVERMQQAFEQYRSSMRNGPVGRDFLTFRNDLSFKILGNPTQASNIALQFSETPNQAFNVTILDLNGQLLYEKSVNTFGESFVNLDAGSLVSGVYFVKVSINNKVGVQKLMIR